LFRDGAPTEANDPFCAGFWTLAMTRGAQAAGVQKVPRHEVAGNEAPAEQRALWGIDFGVGRGGGRDACTRRFWALVPQQTWWLKVDVEETLPPLVDTPE